MVCLPYPPFVRPLSIKSQITHRSIHNFVKQRKTTKTQTLPLLQSNFKDFKNDFHLILILHLLLPSFLRRRICQRQPSFSSLFYHIPSASRLRLLHIHRRQATHPYWIKLLTLRGTRDSHKRHVSGDQVCLP